jgi:hypothetical protein
MVVSSIVAIAPLGRATDNVARRPEYRVSRRAMPVDGAASAATGAATSDPGRLP